MTTVDNGDDRRGVGNGASTPCQRVGVSGPKDAANSVFSTLRVGYHGHMFSGNQLGLKIKATERDRTADLSITNRLLYQLSYGGLSVAQKTVRPEKIQVIFAGSGGLVD